MVHTLNSVFEQNIKIKQKLILKILIFLFLNPKAYLHNVSLA